MRSNARNRWVFAICQFKNSIYGIDVVLILNRLIDSLAFHERAISGILDTSGVILQGVAERVNPEVEGFDSLYSGDVDGAISDISNTTDMVNKMMNITLDIDNSLRAQLCCALSFINPAMASETS